MKKRILCGLMSVIVLLTSGCSLTSNKSNIKEGAKGIQALSKKELSLEQMYVKNNKKYYQLLSTFDSRIESSSIPNKDRMVFLGDDDILVPTLYSDDTLLFYTSNAIPTEYMFERFEDNGYTIGVFKLTKPEKSKYFEFENALENIVYESSFNDLMKDFEDGEKFILRKVDGKDVSPSVLTLGATIKNLEYNKSYDIEYYLGSQCHKDKVKADIHSFTSVEAFPSTDYELTDKSVVEVRLPANLKNGYYLINSTYFVRYCSNKREEGIKDINFNENIDYSSVLSEEVMAEMEKNKREENQIEIDDETENDTMIDNSEEEMLGAAAMLFLLMGAGSQDNPSLSEEMKKNESELLKDKKTQENLYLKDINEKDVEQFVKKNYKEKGEK